MIENEEKKQKSLIRTEEALIQCDLYFSVSFFLIGTALDDLFLFGEFRKQKKYIAQWSRGKGRMGVKQGFKIEKSNEEKS